MQPLFFQYDNWVYVSQDRKYFEGLAKTQEWFQVLLKTTKQIQEKYLFSFLLFHLFSEQELLDIWQTAFVTFLKELKIRLKVSHQDDLVFYLWVS